NPSGWAGPAPDPLDHPEFYEGVMLRRVFGHLIDLFLIILLIIAIWIISLFLHVVTFGLLLLPLIILSPAVTVGYDALQIDNRHSATVGMRTMGLEVRRCLHDYLSGTVVIRSSKAMVLGRR